LTADTAGSLALLQEPGLIDNQHRVIIGQPMTLSCLDFSRRNLNKPRLTRLPDRRLSLPDRLRASYLLMAMFFQAVSYHTSPEESRSP
jgi:hypothetical protein